MDVSKVVDSFTSYNDLTSWAKKNGLENHHHVHLRGIQLLCEDMQTAADKLYISGFTIMASHDGWYHS